MYRPRMPRATANGRVRRTQEERSAETRGRLLDATIESLIDLGYAATTTTVIAERVGLSRGAQLHHFPTKAELVAEAVEHLSRRIGEDLIHETSKLPVDGDRVAAAVDLLWSRYATPLFPAWLELLVASRTDAELRRRLHAVEDRLVHSIQQRAEEIFGKEARAEPGYELAIELTLSLMQGMALTRAVAVGAARRRNKREAAMLAAWKDVVSGLITGR
jgi:AcrR family transcriptional regulator